MTLMETAQLLGNFGEFFGAIAVVGTLIFLAIQIRQSKDAMNANTQSLEEGRKLAMAVAHQERATLIDNAFRDYASSDYLPPIMEKFRSQGVDALTVVERDRLRVWMISSVRRAENVHYQYESGFLDDEFFDGTFRNVIRNQVESWTQVGVFPANSRPSFVAAVKRVLSEEEPIEE